MGIEFKANFDIEKLGQELLDKQETTLARVMEEMAEKIVSRSIAQTDADGKRFVRLSPEYAKRKSRTDRSAVPDLTFTGQMLASITSKVERVGKNLVGRIFFNSAREAEKARGNMKLRKFFALSREQIQTIIDRLTGL